MFCFCLRRRARVKKEKTDLPPAAPICQSTTPLSRASDISVFSSNDQSQAEDALDAPIPDPEKPGQSVFIAPPEHQHPAYHLLPGKSPETPTWRPHHPPIPRRSSLRKGPGSRSNIAEMDASKPHAKGHARKDSGKSAVGYPYLTLPSPPQMQASRPRPMVVVPSPATRQRSVTLPMTRHAREERENNLISFVEVPKPQYHALPYAAVPVTYHKSDHKSAEKAVPSRAVSNYSTPTRMRRNLAARPETMGFGEGTTSTFKKGMI